MTDNTQTGSDNDVTRKHSLTEAEADKIKDTQPNLSDIVKGTPKGNKAVQKALVGAARDQEATKSLAELDKILKQNFSGNYEISCTRCRESIDISYKPSKNAKQSILDWHNKQVKNAVATAEDNLDQYWNKELDKQVGAVLDRLENSIDDGKLSHSMNVIRAAIEAERNKLKELR